MQISCRRLKSLKLIIYGFFALEKNFGNGTTITVRQYADKAYMA